LFWKLLLITSSRSLKVGLLVLTGHGREHNNFRVSKNGYPVKAKDFPRGFWEGSSRNIPQPMGKFFLAGIFIQRSPRRAIPAGKNREWVRAGMESKKEV
jgi:hypothetical protein